MFESDEGLFDRGALYHLLKSIIKSLLVRDAVLALCNCITVPCDAVPVLCNRWW
jgi:hypothetical protein